jgi:hypothetical protein
MPRLELRLRVDPTTRKRSIEVHYQSDADALPIEHEQGHKAIIERLLGRAAAGVDVTRVEERGPSVQSGAPQSDAERTGNKA